MVFSPLEMVSPSFSATAVATDDVDGPSNAGLLQPRAFQYEMLDESLRRNIIVAVRSEPFSPPIS